MTKIFIPTIHSDKMIKIFLTIIALFTSLLHSVYGQPFNGRIVGVVAQEIVSHEDVMKRLRLMFLSSEQQLSDQMIDEFYEQTLNTLIDEIIQKKVATTAGIKISDQEIKNRLLALAKQTGMSMEALSAFLISNGLTIDVLTKQIAASLLWTKYIELKYGNNINISRKDIDLSKKKWKQDHEKTLYHVAEIVLYVTKPDDYSKALKQAQYLRNLLDQGVSFAKLAKEFSRSLSRNQGGSLGMRGLYRLDKQIHNLIKAAEIGTIIGPIALPSATCPKKLVILALLDRKEPSELHLTMPTDDQIESSLRAEALSLFGRKELEFFRKKIQHQTRVPANKN